MKLALAAVHLAVNADVLASPDAYRRHIEASAERALQGACEARVLVFPELAGHLALYANAGPAARRAKTLATALASAAVRRPLEVLRGVAQSRVLDPRNAVLAALAPDCERWWKSVFGPLARRHAAYVVAGSHLRVAPSGALYNASLLFAPDGRLLATTHKVNLVPGLEDGLGVSRGDPDAIPIVDTPLGRIATVIGYDACAAPSTEHERFVPVSPRIAMRGPVAIVAHPTAQAWPAPACGTHVVTARLVGKVLDLEFAGRSDDYVLQVVGVL